MAQQTFPMESSSLKQHAMKGMTMKRNTSESTMSSSSSNNVRNRATMIRQKHANSQELKTRIRSYRRVSIESDDKGLHDDAEAVRKSLQTLEEVMNAMNARTSSGSGLRKAVSIGSMAVLHQSQSSNSMQQQQTSSSKSSRPPSRRIQSVLAAKPLAAHTRQKYNMDKYMDTASKRNATFPIKKKKNSSSAAPRRTNSKSSAMATMSSLLSFTSASKQKNAVFPVKPTRAVPRRQRSGSGIPKAAFQRSNSNRGLGV
ncbi:expressed unknown protein [Seminavis robusta]|uniref:Uncharacterized protein n=1 Tax=Seminavis robusta TaxID=568900 RepID=A0A9N8HKI6_9STRA|nr:expressed unknown protein [Seminavis robusta]|eukprot:Sro619_g176350.1 n/a (257) ;mRNA; f:2339-3109